MAYDENMDITPAEEPKGLLGLLMKFLRGKRASANHFKYSKGGPVDSRLEPNYEDDFSRPTGGMDDFPRVGDYTGGSSSGQGWGQ